MTATLSASEWRTVIIIALIIVGFFTGLMGWIGQAEDCREAGFDRRVTWNLCVYCIRFEDGVVEGRSLKVVREQVTNIAEWGCP